MKATSLKGLPSATVITVEIDPLRSDGKAYVARLKKDGVEVAHHDDAGITHEAFGMAAVVPQAWRGPRVCDYWSEEGFFAPLTDPAGASPTPRSSKSIASGPATCVV